MEEDDVAEVEGAEDATAIGELRAKKRQLQEEIQKKVYLKINVY